MSEEKTLDWLIKKSDIECTILNYATAADFRDWSLLRSILADRLDIDFSSSGGPAMNLTAEEYVAQVKSLIPGFHVTQHQFTNFDIKISKSKAETTVYMQAEHFYQSETEEYSRAVGGYYNHKLECTQDGWKITGLKLTETWSRGDMRAFVLAMERCRGL